MSPRPGTLEPGPAGPATVPDDTPRVRPAAAPGAATVPAARAVPGTAAGPARATGPTTGPATGGWSAEVQALRALAVLLVVGYHLWPGALPGGYVGVDVFFVVSGFLISGQILRDLRRGRFSLRRFYLRRARRLLPAALLVLLVVAVASPLLLPATRWSGTAQQVLASTAYVQNWVLARADVDYLSPQLPPTAVQHFWSLSVEEQFYLGWPVLLLVVSALALRSGPRVRRPALAGVMAVVALVSFADGVRLTADDPTAAYFASTTRIWEFAAGALLVLLLRPARGHAAARGLIAWAGLLAVVASAFLYTAATPFPGWAALLPVAGTVAFLAAGRCDGRWSPGSLVRARPVQLVGDVSYSLYLWHWPVVVLLPAALAQPRLTAGQKLVVLPATVLLAWLTTRFVEDRFRPARTAARPAAGPPAAGPPRRTRLLPALAVLTAAVAATAGGTLWSVHDRVADAQALAGATVAAAVPCFGAPALDGDCTPPYAPQVVVPDPAGALDELRTTYARRHCFQTPAGSVVVTCSLGDPDAGTHVVLFGDSHALQWVPALAPLLDGRDWRLTTVLRASCPPNQALAVHPDAGARDRCAAWARSAVQHIERDPTVDVVLTSAYDNKRWVPADGQDDYWTGVRGYERTWRRLTADGARVVVLHDTPRPLPGTGRVQDCVAADPADPRCGRDRGAATRAGAWRRGHVDPMERAVLELADPAVTLVDLTDAFCGPSRCPAVIGNVLVHADDNHVTPTFARTLAPRLGAALDTALGTPPRP